MAPNGLGEVRVARTSLPSGGDLGKGSAQAVQCRDQTVAQVRVHSHNTQAHKQGADQTAHQGMIVHQR